MSLRALLPGLGLLVALAASAHRGNESRLDLVVQAGQVRGIWDVGLHDLPAMLKATEPPADAQAAAALLADLRIAGDGSACPLQPGATERRPGADADVLRLHFEARCANAPRRLEVDLRTLFARDVQHLALLKLAAGPAVRTAALSAESPRQPFTLGEQRWAERLGADLRSGVGHIASGIDHVLFLLALLLPAVLLPTARSGAARSLREVLGEVFKVVTAFTVAHSLTLTPAGLGWVSLPPRLTESVIALSVLLAALLNLRGAAAHTRWPTAFAFGLVHGFGFASALGTLDASGSALVLTLLGFNLGVELGQLAIVAVFVPLAFAARRRPWYSGVVVRGGSLAIAALALVWCAERAFGIDLLPGA